MNHNAIRSRARALTFAPNKPVGLRDGTGVLFRAEFQKSLGNLTSFDALKAIVDMRSLLESTEHMTQTMQKSKWLTCLRALSRIRGLKVWIEPRSHGPGKLESAIPSYDCLMLSICGGGV